MKDRESPPFETLFRHRRLQNENTQPVKDSDTGSSREKFEPVKPFLSWKKMTWWQQPFPWFALFMPRGRCQHWSSITIEQCVRLSATNCWINRGMRKRYWSQKDSTGKTQKRKGREDRSTKSTSCEDQVRKAAFVRLTWRTKEKQWHSTH